MSNSSFKQTNLQWIVDYDYIRSACHCDADYCRCTTIEHSWVTKINVTAVVEELYRNHSKTDLIIDKYCFDRICYRYKIYDKDLYEIETVAEYYGEEVSGIYFEAEKAIVDAYNELLELNTVIEKIKYCLKLEYGYLIDCVDSATAASIIAVSTDRIHAPQTEYFIRVAKDAIEEYKDRDCLPIAVCIKDGDHYKLIDGYHRYVANKEQANVAIICIV